VQVDTVTTKTDELDDKDSFEEIDVYNRTLNTALDAHKINVNQLRAKSTLR
jgi:hypothetical protein